MSGNSGEASDTYQQLLASTARDNPQRPLWLLRAAATGNAAGRFEATIDKLTAELNLFQQPAQKAEAYLLIGQAQLRSGQPEAAAKSLIAARKADPNWNRGNEAQLLQGQAQLKSGNSEAAEASWKELINADPGSPMADQARYQLAQFASTNEQFKQAVDYYDQILSSGNETGLIPYAQYGKGWALMQIKDFAPALESLEAVLANPEHPLRNDATLARGITLRNLGKFEAAKQDLDKYLANSTCGHQSRSRSL